jgi:hypothetical protein
MAKLLFDYPPQATFSNVAIAEIAPFGKNTGFLSKLVKSKAVRRAARYHIRQLAG